MLRVVATQLDLSEGKNDGAVFRARRDAPKDSRVAEGNVALNKSLGIGRRSPQDLKPDHKEFMARYNELMS